MSRKFNPFSKEYSLDTFGDFSTANVRGQYNLANIKKQIIKIMGLSMIMNVHYFPKYYAVYRIIWCNRKHLEFWRDRFYFY